MKKLRDDQHSSGKTIAALAGVAVGAALLHNTNNTKRLLSEGAPKLGRFLNEVTDDLYGMRLKDYNYNNMDNLIKKHITNQDSTMNNLINQEKEKISLKTTGGNLPAFIIRQKEITENPDYILKPIFEDNYKEIIFNRLTKDKSYNEELTNGIKDLVSYAIDNKNILSHVDEDGLEYYNKEIVDSFIDVRQLGKNKNSFFSDLLNSIDDLEEQYKSYKNDSYDIETGTYDIIEQLNSKITEEVMSKTYGEKLSNGIGDSGVSIKDYIDNKHDYEDQMITINGKQYNLKDVITDFYNNYSSGEMNIDNILLDDKNLKKDASGEVLDFKYINNVKDKWLQSFAGTIPGKLLKITDITSNEGFSNINLFKKNTLSGILKQYGEGDTLSSQYINVLNKLYKINQDNTLSHVTELDDMYIRGNKHGTLPRIASSMFGGNAENYVSNKYLKYLDIGVNKKKTIFDNTSASDGIIGSVSRSISGYSKYNIVDRIYDENLAISDPVKYRNNIKKLNNVFSSIIEAPSSSELKRMSGAFTNSQSIDLIRIAQTDNIEDMLTSLSSKGEFTNKNLKMLVNTTVKNREKTFNSISIKSDMLNSNKRILNKEDILRIEILKEAMLNEAKDSWTENYNYNKIINAIDRGQFTKKTSDNLKNISHWAIVQDITRSYNSNNEDLLIQNIMARNLKLIDLLKSKRIDGKVTANVTYIDEISKAVTDLKNNYKDLTNTISKEDVRIAHKHKTKVSDSMIMRKSYTTRKLIMDTLGDINNATKLKANFKRYGMQYVAGRNSPEYVTTRTFVPYFLTERLSRPFEQLGLGLSNKNTSDVGTMWKAIFTKKVAPIALGITALNYLNFESKNLTGTSMTGAIAQGIANVDLGLKKIADATGIGYILEQERRLNPITQYWFGDNYQDSRERKDYYENGYDEVRKGRWWSFGSASELRGSKISYYQPNYLKRALSNWKDEGLYGGSNEKWKHSWMPTPRHPFAPIRRLLDPYWLEKKHYKDRPYMTTAPLFSSGTPWGAILNPTIGEIIKPVRRMHKNETRRGLIDPKTLIAEQNLYIKEKAINKEKNNLFKFDIEGVSNLSYTPIGATNSGKAIVSMQVGNGRLSSLDYNGMDYVESVGEISDYSNNKRANNQQEYIGGSINNYRNNKFGILDILQSTNLGSSILKETSVYTAPLDILNKNNISIKNKAVANGAQVAKVNLAKLPARIASQTTISRQDEADLLLTSSNHNFISDALFSAKQISGIYGFIGQKLFGDNKRRIRAESADNMISFKRTFWDSNLGGLGGGVMEIARRFFPHQDRSWTEVNYIRNTMPDWIPERFKVGDPYTKVQKGEMRLPGKGYESIHKLRSDMFGRYGALDRMRILGDIAPWSDEYKVWRDIARKTIKDDIGKKEIKSITRRVEEQSKNHKFYNYKFLNTPTEMKNATVASIKGTTITTTKGDIFNLAGIELLDKTAVTSLIQEGSHVNIEYLKDDKKNIGPIQSAIYVNGTNINQELLSSKKATKSEDNGAMSSKALTGQMSQLYGATMEAIAHAPIPFIHSKLMRVETPLESYKNERVYGSPYSTWDHPIKGFINPAFQKAWGRDIVGQGVALGAWYLTEKAWQNSAQIKKFTDTFNLGISETAINKTASVLFNVLNPGAFAGSMIGAVPTGLMSGDGAKGLFSLDVFGAGVKTGAGRKAARLGATAMIAGYGYTRANNPFKSTAIFSVAGMSLAKQLQHPEFGTKEGAVAGAIFGLALSGLKNPRFDKQKMFGIYTPKDTKKRRDIEEYYDRLDYIKYKGLFEKASRKARIFEHTNIEKIINSYEENRSKANKNINKINKRIEKISNSNIDENIKQKLLDKLKSERELASQPEMTLKGGKYTKAAIAYRQAYESTVYGLRDDATLMQVMRSIPKADKDYFMEFAKVQNKKERKRILKYISPYQRKALQIMWGEEHIDDPKSNQSYFRNHFMPGTFWSGWNPRVDMEKVKIKTIKNEGMLLSDFGIYESQEKEPSTMYAPDIKNFDKNNSNALSLKARLESNLNGFGLIGVNVTVSSSNKRGIEVITNIKNSTRVTEYKVRQEMNKIFGTRVFY